MVPCSFSCQWIQIHNSKLDSLQNMGSSYQQPRSFDKWDLKFVSGFYFPRIHLSAFVAGCFISSLLGKVRPSEVGRRLSLDAGRRWWRNPCTSYESGWARTAPCRVLSHAPQEGPAGAAEPSPGTRLAWRFWLTVSGLFFLLGKIRHLPFIKKPPRWVTRKMSWQSGVACGNQGSERGRAWAEGCCDRSQAVREGWWACCAWRSPSSRVPGMDLIMLLGLPLNFQRVLPTLETNLVHGGDGKIHSQGNRWPGEKQSGMIVRCGSRHGGWESREGASVWWQMTECCWGGAVGGGEGNGSDVFTQKGCRIIRKIPLLSTQPVLHGSDWASTGLLEEAKVTGSSSRHSIPAGNKSKLSSFVYSCGQYKHGCVEFFME